MSTIYHSLVVGLTLSNALIEFGVEPAPLLIPALVCSVDPARASALGASAHQVNEASTDAQSTTYLLMVDGRLRTHRGPVVEDGPDFVLELRAGAIRIPRAKVVGQFESKLEAYEHQRERLPDRDPDEQMKLARWCLSNGLPEQAAAQLTQVLAWRPNDAEALAMKQSLKSTAKLAESKRDPGLVQTSATRGRTTDLSAEQGLRELDDSVIARIRRNRRGIGTPTIYDLPEATAVRRFQEYANVIHPILQSRCASCHHEERDSNFRLIRARVPRDLTNPLLVKTNLQTTLALINREQPSYSLLLINAALPHGPEQVPIIPDPNSIEYRTLWNWIDSLKGTADFAATPVETTGYRASSTTINSENGYGGGFASGRGGPSVPSEAASFPTATIGTLVEEGNQSSPSNTPESLGVVRRFRGTVAAPSVPDQLDFQTVSPLIGGPHAAPIVGGEQPAVPPPSGLIPQNREGALSIGDQTRGRVLNQPDPFPLDPASFPTPGGFVPPPGPAPIPTPSSGPTQGRMIQGVPSPAPAPVPVSDSVSPVPTPRGQPTRAPVKGPVVQGDHIILPDGTRVPVFDADDVEEEGKKRNESESERNIDPMLEQFFRQRRTGGNPSPSRPQ